jgi:hypothetical protein
MQRIDENTYIDDTLVTCAEYQLFIDEMREQGQYYQPDHWTSYQFPKGQAHEPILGIRYSDAVTFCEWLTRRDSGEWHYRIPTNAETIEYQLEPRQTSLALGYWILSNDDKSRFVWIVRIPKDPRNIIGNHNFDQDRDLALSRRHGLNHALTSGQILALDEELTIALDRDLSHDRDHALDNTLNSVRNRALDLALDRELDRARAEPINRPLNFTVDLNFNNALERPLERAFDLTLDINFKYAFNFALDRALNLYIDIFTLQERIAGRSPAFEGIRLVKYRE